MLVEGACETGFAGSGVGVAAGVVDAGGVPESDPLTVREGGFGETEPPLMIFRRASSFPRVSSSSCLAIASEVFALTSSKSRDSGDCDC